LSKATPAPVSCGLALLLGLATGCEGTIVATDPLRAGAARIEVRLDPARGLPPGCTTVFFSYAARRTADAAGAPPANVSLGDASADASGSQQCPSPGTFTFPDRFDLKQGTWDISLEVTLDAARTGPLQFQSTCSGVPIRSRTVHVITITQPPAGSNATCTFSL
jgi:hypothetical protein